MSRRGLALGWLVVVPVLLTPTISRGQDRPESQPSEGRPVVTPEIAPPSRTVSLDEAVAVALRQNQDVRVSAAELEAADAQRRQVKGQFFPRVRAEGNILRWDKALELSGFGPPGTPPIVVREATTSTVTLSLIQPVSGIFALLDAYELRKIGVDAATLRSDIRKREVAYQAVEAYYRARQASRLVDVAKQSIEQIDAQVRRARTLESRGVVGRNDVLRAEVAAANAKQRLLQATTNLSVAQARLAFVLGTTGELGAAPMTLATDPAPLDTKLEEAERRAGTQRAELRELDARIAQAGAAVRLARAKLFPQINAVAAYQHNEGLGFVQPKNAGYVGGLLTWDVWDWGSTPAGISEARAQEAQALAAADKVRAAIQLEVRQAYTAAVTSHAALEVVRTSVLQAEENLRIETKRYEAAAATALEVLDAETLVTRERAQLETALYDHLIARAALRKAMGESPEKRP